LWQKKHGQFRKWRRKSGAFTQIQSFIEMAFVGQIIVKKSDDCLRFYGTISSTGRSFNTIAL